MSYAADLHLHSRYAYATSKNITLESLAAWARVKGIDLLSSADFTHPVWRRELEDKLVPVSPGLYRYGGVSFVLGTEVSCVYKQGGRSRRVHLLLFAPDFATVDKLCSAFYNLDAKLESDGRPTLRMSARDLTALALDIDPQCMVIPAHVWTPWFGLFGSKSGFDHLEECFLDIAPHIHAIETGLSSDPAMNWKIRGLGDRAIVSFSDAHSAPKLGRELTVFDGDLGYSGLAEALKHRKVAYSVEFYPEEGKYHYSGHRKCGVSHSPEDTDRIGQRCPVCNRPLTLGVLHRINGLSDGEETSHRDASGFVQNQEGFPPFIRLVPLVEIIAETMALGPASKRVQREYSRIIGELESELNVLAWAGGADLVAAAGETLALNILKVRMGEVRVEPGYDGLYGRVSVGD
jgi:uncharacterized protein (TIGR00375 family)